MTGSGGSMASAPGNNGGGGGSNPMVPVGGGGGGGGGTKLMVAVVVGGDCAVCDMRYATEHCRMLVRPSFLPLFQCPRKMIPRGNYILSRVVGSHGHTRHRRHK